MGIYYPTMSRMMGAIAIVALISTLFLSAAPTASADYNNEISLGYSFYRMHTQVNVVLQKLEVSDFAKGNVGTTIPQDRVEWVRLWYVYENQGDKADQGYLQVELIDSLGNVWPEPDGTYTGETVAPHSQSSQRFIEFPVSKDTRIAKINVIQGFDTQTFDVPAQGSATPTVTVTTTATAAPPTVPDTATPQATAKPGNCLPLLPFALLTALGLAGYAGKKAMGK
jgi:hypothetical protein